MQDKTMVHISIPTTRSIIHTPEYNLSFWNRVKMAWFTLLNRHFDINAPARIGLHYELGTEDITISPISMEE